MVSFHSKLGSIVVAAVLIGLLPAHAWARGGLVQRALGGGSSSNGGKGIVGRILPGRGNNSKGGPLRNGKTAGAQPQNVQRQQPQVNPSKVTASKPSPPAQGSAAKKSSVLDKFNDKPAPIASARPAAASTATNVQTTTAAAQSPANLPEAATSPGVDLVLESIELIKQKDPTSRPLYRVRFRNVGTTPAGRFRIGLVAGFENRSIEESPRAVAEVAGLGPSQVGEVQLSLPKESPQVVGTSSADADDFSFLAAAVDVDESVKETDKTNNVASVARSELVADTQAAK